MKPKHQRLLFISVSVLFLCMAAVLTLRAFRDNIVFFYSPSELAQHAIHPGQRLRIGGLVEEGSIIHESDNRIRFVITDKNKTVEVRYEGMLPSLFRAGQGVVAEGYLEKPGRFTALTILAKHDEKYMPKEVADALKRSGRWQEGQDASPAPAAP